MVRARTSLGDPVYEQSLEAGRELPVDDVIELALRDETTRSPTLA